MNDVQWQTVLPAYTNGEGNAVGGYAIPIGSARADDCGDCHEADLGIASMYATTFAWSRFEEGVHADLDCEDCHQGDYGDVPHAVEETASCSRCHDFETIEEEVAASVHAFGCAYCHDPHAPAGPGLDLHVRDRVDRGNRICRDCHESADRWAEMTNSGSPPADLTEVHAWLPRMGAHKRIVLCVCCHTPSDHHGVHEILPASAAERRCDACHHQDSLVAAKLYGDPQRETWITHDVLFGDAYVKGAMRNLLVDRLFLAVIGLVVLGVGVHGLLRAVAAGRRPGDRAAIKKEYVYDRWVRSWHWVNAVLFLVLGITGFRIHFGGREKPLLSFETAFHVHNLAGFLLALWFVWFVVSGRATGNDNSYLKPPRSWRQGIVAQAKYYLLGIFRGDPHPFHASRRRRFNPLQQLVYLKVMYVVFPLLAVTGVFLLFPEWLPETLAGHAAGWMVATIHYLSAAVLTVFLGVHLYLITFGDEPGFGLKSMLDGQHRRHGEK